MTTPLFSRWLSDHLIKTLPIFITLNLVALSIWQLNISSHTMPLVLGVIAGGLVDLDNSLSGRLKNLLISLLAFAVSAVGASFSLALGWLFVPLAMFSTFALVMLGAIGQRYSTIAFGTLVVAVYTSLTYQSEAIWWHSVLMILAGAFLYGVVGMLVHLIFPNRLAQENLANAFSALSRYLNAKSTFFDPDDDNLTAKQLALAAANSEVMTAFDQTRVSLFYRLQGITGTLFNPTRSRQARTQRLLRYYFTAQDLLERASSSHYQYQELFAELQNSDLMFRFQRVLELQASACLQIAYALRHRQPYQHSPKGEKAMQGLLASLQYHQARGLKNAHRWQSIAENLHHIERQLSQMEAKNRTPLSLEANPLSQHFAEISPPERGFSSRLIAENVSGLGNMWRAIRQHLSLSSPLFRHAIRLALVVLVCSLLVPILQLDSKGYWILLTAIFVCQPNYAATKKRLTHRVIGTILGVLAGVSFEAFNLAPSLEAQLGLLVLTGSLYTFFRFSHYGFSTFYITLFVLLSLDVIGIGAEAGVLPRIFDTLLGTLVAWLAVSFVFPDWKYLNLRQNLTQVLHANARYLQHILGQLQFGYHEQLAYRVARREAHLQLSALSLTVSNMHSEPKKYASWLESAPKLLGVYYSLLGYISALAAYRKQGDILQSQLAFSVVFFEVGKKVVKLMEALAQTQAEGGENIANFCTELTVLDQQLSELEGRFAEENSAGKGLALTLIHQLRLLIQILPQLEKSP